MEPVAVVAGAGLLLLALWRGKKRSATGDVQIHSVNVQSAAAATGVELEREKAQQAQRSALNALGMNWDLMELRPANYHSPSYAAAIQVAKQVADELDRVGLPGEATFLRGKAAEAVRLTVQG